MKTYSEEVCKKLNVIFCDVCGESCKPEGYLDNEHALLSATWGYDSNKDLIHHNIDLCESCFDKTIDFLKSQRKHTPEDNDPFDGLEYHPI